jgi:hypothetical protein
MQLAPDEPQLLCRPIEQPGDFGFDQARLSGSVVPIKKTGQTIEKEPLEFTR